MSLQGKVKWYNVRKGYGFITPIGDDAEQEDIFVHATGIDGDPLQDEDEVQYDIKMDQGRPKAVNVTGGTGENRPYFDRNSQSRGRFGGGDRYEAGGYNNRGGNRYSNKYEGGSYGDRDDNRGGGFRSNNRSFGDRDGGSRRGFGMRRNFGGRGGGQRERNNICYSFRDTGSCRFGDSCCFEHTQAE